MYIVIFVGFPQFNGAFLLNFLSKPQSRTEEFKGRASLEGGGGGSQGTRFGCAVVVECAVVVDVDVVRVVHTTQ